MAQKRRDVGWIHPNQDDTYSDNHSAEGADKSQQMNTVTHRGPRLRHSPADGGNLPTETISSEDGKVHGTPRLPGLAITQSGSGSFQSSSPQRIRSESQRAKPDPASRLDYEKVHDYPLGTPRLAAFMNSSDHNAVYRRFGRLSARLLVQLEVELTGLETKLDELDRKDAADKVMKKRLRGYEIEGDDGAQTELLKEIQEKLSQYFEVLLYESQVRALEPAPPRHHLGLFDYMRNRKPLAPDRDDFILHVEDFVSVAKKSESGTRITDVLEIFMASCPRIAKFLHLKRILQTKREREKIEDDTVDQYSEFRFGVLNKVVAVSAAVCTLLIPVMLLFLVDMSKQAMAWLVFVFVLAFCVMVSVVTGARAQDIFIATAAYAAVLVTFLGNLSHG
ncbi:uncharacterized protein LY89DRAFT_713875 [Mollisia scopiformis]|uniref:DUF6594 domain-containing protein n=1 Tax=Mollisia scopiformis TaxID=149040 RepID=A0A194XT75_MOLSC|nr:uncharacterized protein LY89DRAFT_713875 [Mollisia scopiformis]KUJ23408.1 hypothetical protein LY89DRAFT_713875 [Mollisia scopiformis]